MTIRIFLLLVLTATAQGQDGVMNVETWKVQSGDNSAWAAPDFDDHDWPAGELPGVRVAGFRWYRATVTIPAKWKDESLALAFGPMGEAFEVFVDGVPAGRLGVLDPAPVSKFVRHLSFDLPPVARGAGILHIAVRRWMGASSPYLGNSLPLVGGGYLGHVPQLGPFRLMQTRERLHTLEGEKSAALTQGEILFGGFAGLLALVLFAQRRERLEYFWLGSGFVVAAMSMLIAIFAVKLDLPVRSAIPALSTLLSWWAPVSATMLMRELCPRLRWPQGIAAALYLVLAVYSAFTMLANQVFYNPIAYLNAIFGAMQVAVAILIFRDNRRGFALAASLLLVPIVLVPTQFGFIRGRYVWEGYDVDLLQACLTIYAVITLTVLWLRSRDEQREQQAREQELAAGQRVQQLLLESTGGTPGYQVEKAYLPAREVGGDFYQLIPRADGGLLAVVGDVSGKGLEAAMIGARLLGALEPVNHLLPGEVLARLNEALQGRTRGGFVTCCCALFAPDGTVTFANAGHLAPYVDGAEIETGAGLPLGLAPAAEYAETRMAFGSGAMTFLTDGVVEAESAQRELFGFERTREISGKSAQEIAEAAKAWGQNDDITVVTVRRMG